MTIDQINAMNRFALKHKRGWKDLLNQSWMRAGYPAGTSDDDKALLQQLRNNGGPTIVSTFQPRPDGFRRVGYLKQARREHINSQRAWTANAWHIVTEAGDDIVQPWCDKKTEARNTAATLGIFLVGVQQ